MRPPKRSVVAGCGTRLAVAAPRGRGHVPPFFSRRDDVAAGARYYLERLGELGLKYWKSVLAGTATRQYASSPSQFS